MEDFSGRIVRDYELKERIGAGGFGAVYRAWQSTVDREVAVKVILPEYADHPDFIIRFETEAQLVARLEHPYIIPLYEYWRDETGAYLAMRWLKGGSLRDRVERGPIDLPELDQLLDQIGGALAFSHDHGVIHRDLKPENILLDEAENAYLTDFGIAKDLAGPSRTEAGKIIGSVDYLSPEQAKGEPITRQTDVYALGVVIFELLTCEHPFPNSTPVQMIQKHLNEPLPSILIQRPDLPTWVDEITWQATAKVPDDRYPDAQALVADFHQAMTAPEQRMVVPKLPAFLAQDRQVSVRDREVFVAREPELTWLGNALSNSVEGQGNVNFVVGNSGRGKTALLDEFMRQAEENTPDLLVASGASIMHSGMGDAYLPFRQILELLTGDVERGWRAGWISSHLARRLWANVLDIARELVESAPDLINRLVPGPALAARVKTAGGATKSWWPHLNQLVEQEWFEMEELKQAFLFEQCSRFLRSVSLKVPLLLLMDDLQWADAASIGLLFHLGRSISSSRILLIGAYRPDEVALGRVSPMTGQPERHPLERVVNELTRIHGETAMDLGQEDAERDRAFVEAYLDTEPNKLDNAFRRALYEHAEGHPLFTVELLRAMQERGELVLDEDGRWVQGDNLDWDDLPIRVEAVIAERIGRLNKEQRELVSVASVEGEEFTAQVVARMQEIPERRILHELAEQIGKRHRLVRQSGEERIGSQLLARFKFSHHLFQRYIYIDLSIGERRLLHRQIAHVLEDLYGEQVMDIAVPLARHFQAARAEGEALPYLVHAGNHARDQYANEVAERYYKAALDQVAGERRRAELLWELGRILERRSQFDESIEVWKEAIELYRALGDWNEVANLYARSARQISTLAHDHRGALNICLAGLSVVPDDLESRDMAALLHETGRAHLFNARSDDALKLCDQALRMAERHHAIDVRADTLATWALVPALDPEEAIRALEEAVELAESGGFLRIGNRAHHNLGFMLFFAVGISAAASQILQAANIDLERGNLEGQWGSQFIYAYYTLMKGELDDADRAIAELGRIGRVLGIAEERELPLKAERMVLGGQLERALQRLEKSRTYFQERGELQSEFDALFIMANALLELHQFDKAVDVLKDAAGHTDLGVRSNLSKAMLSRTYSLAGDIQRARKVLSDAREIAGQKVYATEQAYLSWANAHLSVAEEDWPNALEMFRDADSTFEQLEHRWDQSRVIRDWAEMHADRRNDGDVEEARYLLERAQRMYEEMNMPFYVAKVAERLRSLHEE